MEQEIPAPTELSQIHILDHCNLKCTHCYVGDNRFKPRDMPEIETIKKRIKTISDFSKAQGFKDHTMNISGGEPTLREGETRLFVEDPPYCTTSGDLVEKRAGCAAFICLLTVDVDGSIYPCRKAPVKMGHIDDLESAWNSPTAIRLRNRDFDGKCGSCDIKWSCGGCRGYAASKGNILGSDDRCSYWR